MQLLDPNSGYQSISGYQPNGPNLRLPVTYHITSLITSRLTRSEYLYRIHYY